ncbi:unnamed protein product, partial [Nippostrongylus brasiliensis]|uniref:Squalene synthase n=1 Tax=Nippostrongylus brasiliensis TaxID=27835 RepID=A0A0N4YZU5_NIPBR
DEKPAAERAAANTPSFDYDFPLVVGVSRAIQFLCCIVQEKIENIKLVQPHTRACYRTSAKTEYDPENRDFPSALPDSVVPSYYGCGGVPHITDKSLVMHCLALLSLVPLLRHFVDGFF